MSIQFSEAIPIAVLGLVVNIVSAWLLSHGGHGHGHNHEHNHSHDGSHGHSDSRDPKQDNRHRHSHHNPVNERGHDRDQRDYNMRAASIHVIADTAVSVLAIIGLLLANYFSWLWMDPLAGVVGALVIFSWSVTLAKDTGAILLDMDPGNDMKSKVAACVQLGGDQLLDLHIWRLGPGHFAAVLSVLTHSPERDPAFYHAMLRAQRGLSHMTVEVHHGP